MLGFLGFGSKIEKMLDVVKPIYGLMKGQPSNEPIKGAYWRMKDTGSKNPIDPLETDAGLIWVSPVLSNKGSEALDLLNVMNPIYSKYGFESRCLVCWSLGF